ncbi:SDR family NAD(P)-dependent oxidoreductase [Blastococcus sp. TF02A-30]|uniref:SDR family NAD(P)-dependent oxidoreductase n=1 Tax=Blastococcus sp. TF02A-30 TaxID=2250580 RepID=UPI000DEBABBD|nr:SDR family NAD(P)-dependent oxidoreductase [Blastococcus sp. TF02A-30]RBY87871.1 SDR family oxidoreductase [Blastococcus sp. TF02A-30]
MSTRRVAVVTGASSGIGAATARALAGDGYDVVLGARRLSALEEVAASCGGRALPLGVTDPRSVAAFAAEVPRCDVLVNNAGGAKGADPVATADEAAWYWMHETNVMGTLRVTKALLPRLIASGDGLVLNVGSIAAREPYSGGAGYNAAKHAVAAMTRVLRIELLGQPVRVTEIDPGLVRTQFSLVRFDGDTERADAVYRGMTPLTAEDVADCVRWVASMPAHVNVDSMLVLARDQVSAQVVHRV